MLNLNRVEVIGNLTRDPELKTIASGRTVTSFAIATNRRYKDQGGNWIDSPPEFHDVSVWGPLGERCNQVLRKGERVYVSGRIETRSWDAPDGTKKSRSEVVAELVIGPDLVNKSMGGRDGGDDGGYAAPARTGSAPSAPAAPKRSAGTEPEEINIDDIPF